MAVVAIDGPSGAGKSSVSRAVATNCGWSYLDTGALYRALTLFALESQLEHAHEIPQQLTAADLLWVGNPAEPGISLRGQRIDDEIRSQRVTEKVSEIAADPAVRAYLLALQRSIINEAHAFGGGIVVEGRDIGTTVWPDAELKIFLTADLDARAQRRNAQLQEVLTDSEVQRSLAARDVIDSTRSLSPLRQTPDQVVIDATYLSLEQVVTAILHLVHELKLSDVSGAHE